MKGGRWQPWWWSPPWKMKWASPNGWMLQPSNGCRSLLFYSFFICSSIPPCHFCVQRPAMCNSLSLSLSCCILSFFASVFPCMSHFSNFPIECCTPPFHVHHQLNIKHALQILCHHGIDSKQRLIKALKQLAPNSMCKQHNAERMKWPVSYCLVVIWVAAPRW